MSIDIFGRSSVSRKSVVLKGPPGIGFSLTNSGNFDIKSKRLCNIGEAVDLKDAVNLKVFLEHMKVIEVKQKRFEEDMLKKLRELSDKINDYNIEQKKFSEEINKKFVDSSEDVNIKTNKVYFELEDRMGKAFALLTEMLDKKFDEVHRNNWL